MKKILLIDDDPKITGLLARGLRFEGYHIEVANDGLAGLYLAEMERPDLIILDVMMPGMSGLEVCRHIRERISRKVSILMLTAKDDVSDRILGLDSGADDYLVKPFAFDELLARMRALFRRQGLSEETDNGEVLAFGDLQVALASREVKRGERVLELTAKEYDLLVYFLRHPRQVLSKERLLQQVWDFKYIGESNVVEVYIGYLRQKTEQGGRPRLIHTLRGAGYMLKEPV